MNILPFALKTTALTLITISILSCGGSEDGTPSNNGELVAHAGFDQTIRSGSQVTLSGKNSDKKNAIATRNWTAKSDLGEGKRAYRQFPSGGPAPF